MKKTLTINLGGFIFHIDEDAFNQLERYLGTLRNQFSRTSGGDEIIADVETRMAELFRERNGETKEVVNTLDVEAVISVLGKPEDYLQEEDYNSSSTDYDSYQSYSKKIHRDVDNRMIGGVAAGLAAYMNINPVWTRLLFFALFFSGFGLLLYIILWIVVPSARTTAGKLQMRGKPVTLSNIENFVREEAHAVGNSVKHMGRKAQDMNRNSNQVTGLISQFFNGIFEIIKLIFKFAFKIIGFFFLFVVFVALASLATTLFVGFNLNDSHYTWSEISDMLQLVSNDSGIYNAITFGFSLLVLGPLFLIVYYGIRLVFGVEPLNRGVRKGLGFLSLIGLIILGSTAYQLSEKFRANSYHISEQKLNLKAQSYNLEVVQDDIYYDFNESFNTDFWTFSNGKSYYKGVKLDIRQSEKGYTYLETEFNGRGSSRQDARKNAQNLDFIIEVDSANLKFSNYYSIREGNFFRLQKIRHVLYMQPGDTVYLSAGTENLIYDVKNINDFWEYDMTSHYWTMTEKGLLCADCENSAELLKELEEDNFKDEDFDQRETEANSQVKIKDGLIIIEEAEAFLFPLKQNEAANTNYNIAVLITPFASDVFI